MRKKIDVSVNKIDMYRGICGVGWFNLCSFWMTLAFKGADNMWRWQVIVFFLLGVLSAGDVMDYLLVEHLRTSQIQRQLLCKSLTGKTSKNII